jgi:hypothetical protein
MGIHDKPIAPLSPWQNGFAERLIGSVRRECLDHTIFFGEGSPAPVADLLRKLSQPNQNASRASERRADPRPIERIGI